jgi:hypothetical protein
MGRKIGGHFNVWRCTIEALDEGPFEVSKWEADFLDSLLDKEPYTLTERQVDVLKDMCEKYHVMLPEG